MDTDIFKRNGRSKLTNGKLFQDGHRSGRARRIRDLLQLWEARLPYVDESSRLLMKRAAALTVLCEEMDERIAGNEEDVSLADYSKASGQLFRLLRSLGLTNAKPPAEDANALESYLLRRYGIADLMKGAPDHMHHIDDDDDDEPRRVVSGAKRVKRRASRYRDSDEED